METVTAILGVANDHPYLSLASAALGCAAIIRSTGRRRSCLPPGPKGHPIVGNLFDFPPTHAWEKFGEFSQQYGALSSLVSNFIRTDPHGFTPGEATYLNLLGQPWIVLNSYKAAVDLLERKSSIYSNRPVLMLSGEIVGFNNTLPLLQHGPRSREFRKYMGKLMGTRASVERFSPLLEKESAKFVVRVMADPGSLVKQIKKWVTKPDICCVMSRRLLTLRISPARCPNTSGSHEHLGPWALSS
jgi:hypothetical protein